MMIDFCVPVRNEEKILEANLIKLRDYLVTQNYSFKWRIVVVLNNCADNSESIIKRLVSENANQFKYLSINPEGKGGALKHYFSLSRADILVFMDIDLAVSLEDLNALLNPILNNEADLVFGSRLLESSKVERSFFRSASSIVYNYLSRKFLSHNFSDLQCGFKAFRREVFSKVETYLKDNKWFFDTEFIILAKLFKFRLYEIPVNWTENRYAQRVSKINVYRNTLSFIKNLIRLHREIINLKKHHDNV